MDKKLIAAFTFGLLAVSVANLLLSAGIVSLILTERSGTSTENADTGSFPNMWMTTRNSVSLDGTNNTTTAAKANATVMPAANVTVTPAPTPSAAQVPAGLPAGGQYMPPAGQTPPSGDPSQFSGQAPPSGQLPSGTGQMPSGSQQITSGTGQLPSGTGQSATGSGSLPANTSQSLSDMGYLPVDVTSLMGSRSGATPTPKPSSFLNNFSGLWNQ